MCSHLLFAVLVHRAVQDGLGALHFHAQHILLFISLPLVVRTEPNRNLHLRHDARQFIKKFREG